MAVTGVLDVQLELFPYPDTTGDFISVGGEVPMAANFRMSRWPVVTQQTIDYQHMIQSSACNFYAKEVVHSGSEQCNRSISDLV